MMTEAIAKVNELVGVLQQTINRHAKAVKDIEVREASFVESEKAISERELEITKRENKIKGIENVVKFHEEAIALKNEANAMYDKVQAEKKAFALEVQTKTEALAKQAQTSNILAAKIEKENVMLQKEWAALNKEKEEYKNNLLNEIKNRIS